MYRYTLLKQDGTKEDLGVSKRKGFEEFRKILSCGTIEIIPTDYYKGMGYGRCNMYGDEEARFNGNNKRNPHFKVLKDLLEGNEWDVVGNIIMEIKEVK